MKLQTALALLIWGSNHCYGNAFAASTAEPIAFRADSSLINLPFIAKRISSGGASTLPSTSATVLSATIDGVEVTCPESVAKFISTDNWSLLSARGKQALANLIQGDDGIGAQEHVYKDWPELGTDDEGKVQLCEQVSWWEARMILNSIFVLRRDGIMFFFPITVFGLH